MLPICRRVFSCSRFPVSKDRLPFDLSLYLVANRPSFQDENLFFSKIKELVRGGVTCVQLRDHKNDLASVVRTAICLKEMIQGIPLFINTLHPFEVVRAADAEGIYLEEKLSYVAAREQLGRKIIIGVPVKTMNEVLAAEHAHEIDYLSVKVAPSKKTCPRNDQLWGMEGLRSVRAISSRRIVAIGGLHLECAESIYRELHLDDGLAAAGGLMEGENPFLTAQKMQTICQRVRGES